jgi:hypothetical protein
MIARDWTAGNAVLNRAVAQEKLQQEGGKTGRKLGLGDGLGSQVCNRTLNFPPHFPSSRLPVNSYSCPTVLRCRYVYPDTSA